VEVLLGGGGGAGGGAGGGGLWWRRRPTSGVQGGRSVGPLVGRSDFLVFENALGREHASSWHMSFPRGFSLGLGKGPFASPMAPSGHCREFPLGIACAERNRAFVESVTLSAKPSNPVVSKEWHG
jgi:hypothetical protein